MTAAHHRDLTAPAAALAASLRGSVHLPGDPGYDEAAGDGPAQGLIRFVIARSSRQKRTVAGSCN